MNWKLKGMLQRALSHLPYGSWMHFHLQRRFGGLRDFNREFDVKLSDWTIMLRRLGEAGFDISGKRLFEIGSGWYPTFPLACYLGGAARVTTVDLNRHMRPGLLRACAERLGENLSTLCAATGADEASVRARHSKLIEVLGHGGDLASATSGVIDYRAPADATRTGLEDGQIDCIFSNSVLEHVPLAVIGAMFAEARRILDTDGVMFHSVNCGDHYAYVDRSINQLNYLRFSDEQWNRWNNAFLYQNRLRAHVFIEQAEAAGFEILLNTAKASDLRLSQLASMPVHPQFSAIPAERLCITSIDFIARKSVNSEAAAGIIEDQNLNPGA
ncbi:class I SAM-dependent methyltransferase [Dokdonella immobilis]|uniref:Methyltransferase domain-containing protein n=1 Tax=Dokdonella immobilis TaxID=578942 RepID=A0A1I4VGM2_9GAMM|nr:class I SAM-dependent methyltransferase [Dokdonella immobilis]SFN00315.1 Methyltransferase domain-containing protein [Dokdonella immobilis]